MRVRALVSRGARAELAEVDLDDPRDDEVVVRIEAVGLCHTDLVTRRGLGQRPAVLGHEGCGVVERAGRSARGVAVGDRVVISFASCGRCRECLGGHPAYCLRSTDLNGRGRRTDGSATLTLGGEPVFGSYFGQSSFATHVLARASACVPVGDLAPHLAAPLACGFLTGAGAVLNVLRPRPGDRLLVAGAGSVGTAAVLTARSEGVEVVDVVDPLPQRRALAVECGATALASWDELPEVTHALDTTGRPEVVARALARLRTRGVLALVGLGAAEAVVDIRDLMLRGLQLRGCVEGDAVPGVLVPELVRRHRAGAFPVERLVTTYPLADFDRAVADQAAGRVLKPVLLPPT